MDIRVNGTAVSQKRVNLNNKNNTVSANRASQKSLKSNVSFNGALTTAELNRVQNLIGKAKPHLGTGGTKTFSVTFFQAAMPSVAGQNPGIGTIYSKAARKLIKTIAKLTGLNNVLVGPDGIYDNKCPYDGSPFTLNPKAIDLPQLDTPEYGHILKSDAPELKKLFDENPNKGKWGKAAFDHVNANFEPALKAAHQNFKKLDESHPLKQEYNAFLQKPGVDAEEMDRQAVQFALSKEHGNYDWNTWGDLDRELFGDKENSAQAQDRISQVKAQRPDDVEFFKWSQFIVRKHHDETVKDLENEGISMTGDCLVGFSQKIDGWTHKADLEQGRYAGIPEAAWGFPLPKEGERGDKLIERKFESYLGRYSSVRVDAARLLTETCTYSETENGKPKNYQMRWNGDKFFRKFIEIGRRIHGDKWNLAGNVFENLGSSKDHSVQETNRVLHEFRQQGTPMPQVHISAYMPQSLWREGNRIKGKYNEADGVKDIGDANSFVAIGSHDNQAALAIDGGDTGKVNNRWSTMINHFSNISLWGLDLFGKSERYNDFTAPAELPNSNWEERLPEHAEEFYHQQLANGYGFNGPEVFKNALSQNHPDNHGRAPEVAGLIDQLNSYAQILKDKNGPMTVEEADKQFGKDTIRGK